MNWKQIPLGPIETNCYILYNDEKECLIFDPGAEGENLISWIENEGLKPLAVFLTHAHFDHIGAVEDVRNHWQIPVYIHELEGEWLTNAALNGSARYPMEPITGKPADHLLQSEEELTVGPFALTLFETPGHSPGSISYYVKDIQAVFAGDALFAGSIGRTDLPGGDYGLLIESIKNKLLTLPGQTIVLPGHGPATTIEKEKQSNPFLTGRM